MLSWKIVGTILAKSRGYKLTHPEKHVLATLAHHRNNRTGLIFPSVATLAEETELSRRTVQRCLRSLESKSLITTRRNPKGWGSSFYTLTIPGIEFPPLPRVSGARPHQPRSPFRDRVRDSHEPRKGEKEEKPHACMRETSRTQEVKPTTEELQKALRRLGAQENGFLWRKSMGEEP